MARIVADGLELQDTSNGYYFELRRGGLSDHPSVRGSDWVIPGKAGRETGDRVKDIRDIVLHGIVVGTGQGDTGASSYRTRMDALKAVFDPTAAPFDLVVHGPLEGLGTGETATINVRFLRFVVGQSGEFFRVMDIECESIDSPPEWVIGS